MITRTAKQLIRKSLRSLAVAGQGQTLDAEQENDAFADLNEMLAGWVSFMIPAITQESFALVSGQSAYTIGTGGDFNTTHPLNIYGGFVRIGSTDYQLKQFSGQDYSEMTQKSNGGIPECFFYRDTFPLGTIYLDEEPTEGTIYLDLHQRLTEMASLTTSISLPPEYYECIWSNLCLRIAPEYEVQVPREIALLAMESKAGIESRNFSEQVPNANFDRELTNNAAYRYEIQSN